MSRMSSQTTDGAAGFVRTLVCTAPRERVFDAVTTLDGVRRWWTPIVTGSAQPGGTLTFGFEGLDEVIVMRVEAAVGPSEVRWTCVDHSSAPGWAGTEVSFELSDAADDACTVTFRHTGIAAATVEQGWDRFLPSLVRFVETGAGDPYRASNGAFAVARAYHEAWTHKDFAAAIDFLSPDLAVDTPVNDYPTTESFAAALTAFGSQATKVELLSGMSNGDEAMLLYDMDVPGIGTLRVAEQFRVTDDKITAIRQVHDTVAIRAAGWG